VDKILNNYTGYYEPFVLLVDVVNLDADWLHMAYGKQLEALGAHPGDMIEFNAAIDSDQLKRPTKFELRKDD
jgi:hypothetical protein